MATKSPEATIEFLLLCIENAEPFKCDFEEVAKQTGWYKGGKFARQAFTNIKAKYGNKSWSGTGEGDTRPTETKEKAGGKRKAAGSAKGNGKKQKKAAVAAAAEDTEEDQMEQNDSEEA